MLIDPRQAPASAPMHTARFTPRSHLGTWWGDHGGEVVVGIVTAVASAVATYFVMRIFERRERGRK